MNCEEFKNQIIISIYGEQTSEQKNASEKHILECPKCAKIYKQTKTFSGVYEDKSDIPFPHWGKSWQVISERVFEKKRFTLEFIPRHKVVFAVVASLLIFIFGVLLKNKSAPNYEEIFTHVVAMEQSFMSDAKADYNENVFYISSFDEEKKQVEIVRSSPTGENISKEKIPLN
jgi:hypothetical protein